MFVALSGSAYALTVPRNSVGAKQLKKSAVTRPKIKQGAVTSAKVANGSLLAQDFKAGQRPRGERSEPGPRGEQKSSQDAPRLYAYVGDTPGNDAIPAVVYYGAGVNSVRDLPGADHIYDVTFSRSLKGCVVLAVPGTGFPHPPNFSGATSYPDVLISPPQNLSPAVARVLFHSPNNLQTDTSFMIAAIC